MAQERSSFGERCRQRPYIYLRYAPVLQPAAQISAVRVLKHMLCPCLQHCAHCAHSQQRRRGFEIPPHQKESPVRGMAGGGAVPFAFSQLAVAGAGSGGAVAAASARCAVAGIA
jgi:hypothetical protein